MNDLMKKICCERPVGTSNNTMINTYLENLFIEWGYDIISIPFDCVVWNKGISKLDTQGESFEIKSSPYSNGFTGNGELIFADSVECLEKLNCDDKILLLSGELTQTPLQPKDYPFYYPDEHKIIIDLLEQKAPQAIIALTGNDELCGLSPFPLFDDGNFLIPSACMSLSLFETVKKYIGTNVRLSIVSSKHEQKSRQIIATKQGKNKGKRIVICAHMDSKYNTPGALDNAAGVAVLMETAKKLNQMDYSIDIVPFNGEEYYNASGELAYLQYLKDIGETVSLLINIDSPCHIGANSAVSFYNFDSQSKDTLSQLFTKYKKIVEGQQWYAGDHCAFIFSGIPCAAIASSDLFEGGLANTHTQRDTLDCVDIELISITADYIKEFICFFIKK